MLSKVIKSVVGSVAVAALAFGGFYLYKTQVAVAAYAPEWDPTGQFVIFYQWEQGDEGRLTRMYKINPDGSGKQQFGPENPGYPSLPSYSSDGQSVIYSDLRNIYRLNMADQSIEQLTDAHDIRYFGPQFSPDGSKIVYDNMNNEGFIHFMNADGSGEIKTTVNGARPAYSPDGQTVVYHAKVNEVQQLMLMTADGKPMRQLTDKVGDSFDPSFSPDGRYVVFFREVEKDVNEAFELELATGNERQLTFMGKLVWGIDYSPNGEKLVLAAEGMLGSNLYMMDRAGGEPVKFL